VREKAEGGRRKAETDMKPQKLSQPVTESASESPAWHAEVLRERAENVKSGKETFMDWEMAKKQTA
jgi:hypothetical protein